MSNTDVDQLQSMDQLSLTDDVDTVLKIVSGIAIEIDTALSIPEVPQLQKTQEKVVGSSSDETSNERRRMYEKRKSLKLHFSKAKEPYPPRFSLLRNEPIVGRSNQHYCFNGLFAVNSQARINLSSCKFRPWTPMAPPLTVKVPKAKKISSNEVSSSRNVAIGCPMND